MSDINDYLLNVYGNFYEYLKSSPRLCKLKTMNYDTSNLPEYQDIHIEELYHLRYTYAYAFEYKYIFQDLFAKEKTTFLPTTYNMLSVGCGSGIDYWGASAAANQEGVKCKINYIGVDLVEWKYPVALRKGDSAVRLKINAVDFFSSYQASVEKSNIILFPKSISEFDSYGIRSICNHFKKTDFKQKRIHIIASLRANNNINSDLTRFNLLIDALKMNEHHKFTLEDDNYRRKQYSSIGEEGIRGYDSSFIYPEEAKNVLTELYQYCDNYKRCGSTCDASCKNRLTRKPKLTAKDCNYKIATLIRTGDS